MRRVHNFFIGVWEGFMEMFPIVVLSIILVALVGVCAGVMDRNDRPRTTTIIIEAPETTTTTERLCEPYDDAPIGVEMEVCR